jgi:CRP-like cAMP-binding protein
VGRKESAPFGERDLAALASYLSARDLEAGEVLFRAGDPPSAVCIVQEGGFELFVGSGPRRVIVQLLEPALDDTRCLVLPAEGFERLVAEHPVVARRWLSSKAGRVRVFRLAADGRALTTALVNPGTIFGEIVLLGQRMHDNFAEALEEAVVCVMSRDDVQRLLLSDPRIAARIAGILGARLAEMERRLSDTVFKSAAQRIAATLATLASDRRPGIRSRAPQVLLTHEQIAALVGTSRETATKVLGDLASQGLIRLSRGRITVLDPAAVAARAGA